MTSGSEDGLVLRLDLDEGTVARLRDCAAAYGVTVECLIEALVRQDLERSPTDGGYTV